MDEITSGVKFLCQAPISYQTLQKDASIYCTISGQSYAAIYGLLVHYAYDSYTVFLNKKLVLGRPVR